MTAEKFPPGIDSPKDKPGKIRARFRCNGCDKHGKPGQHSRLFPKRGGVRAAQQWMREERSKVDKGTFVAESKATVGEAVQAWIDSRRRIKASTRDFYERMAKHVAPIADRPMQAVKPHEIDAWVGQLTGHLSPTTVRSVVALVRSTYDIAVKRGQVARSPFIEIDLPTVERREVVALTVEQVEQIAAAMPERYRIGVYLQAALGLRPSEVLGLRVADFMFLASPAKVRIKRQLAPDGATFVTPKTDSSVRDVVLAERVKVLAAEHIRKYPNDAGLVLSSPYGNPVSHKVYGRAFRAARGRVRDLPDGVTPHTLRHHAASMLVAQGVPVNIVAKFLGHTDATMVLRVYAHLLPDADDVTARALAAIWAPNVSESVSQGVAVDHGQGA